MTGRSGSGEQGEAVVARFLAMHRLMLEIAAGHGLDDLLTRIVAAAASLCGTDSGTLYRWDAQAGLICVAANLEIPERDTTPPARPGEGLAGTVWERGTPVVVNDYPGWPSAMPSGIAGGMLAGLGVPLQADGRQLGVLLVRRYTPGPSFTDEDGTYLELLASQAAQLIVRAEMQEEHLAAERKARAEAEAITEIGQFVSESLDLDRVLQRAIEAARELINVDRAFLALPDGLGRARVAAAAGAGMEISRRLRFAAGIGTFGRVIASGRPYQTVDYLADTRVAHDPESDAAARTALTRSVLAVPIKRGAQIIGIFRLASESTRNFTDAEVALVERLAIQVAVAIEHAQTHAREQEAHRETEALLVASTSLGAQGEPDDVLKQLVEQSALLLGPETASCAFAAGEELSGSRYWQKGAWVEQPFTAGLTGSITGLVWRTGRPYRSNDLASDPHTDHQADARYLLHSQMAVPLLGLDGERLGVVSVFNSPRAEGFTERDERLLVAFCASASTVLRRARDAAARRQAIAERARLDGVILAARGMAHEINQDLGVIVGRTDILEALVQQTLPQFAGRVAPIREAALGLAEKIARLQKTWRVVSEDVEGIGPILDIEASSKPPPGP